MAGSQHPINCMHTSLDFQNWQPQCKSVCHTDFAIAAHAISTHQDVCDMDQDSCYTHRGNLRGSTHMVILSSSLSKLTQSAQLKISAEPPVPRLL